MIHLLFLVTERTKGIADKRCSKGVVHVALGLVLVENQLDC
jgi:hypothetical protein